MGVTSGLERDAGTTDGMKPCYLGATYDLVLFHSQEPRSTPSNYYIMLYLMLSVLWSLGTAMAMTTRSS